MARPSKSKKAAASASNIFPAEESLTFLLADDIRQEVRGKISLIGYFAGSIIYVDPVAYAEANSKGKKLAIPLAIVFCTSGGVGTFKTRISIVTPEGQDISAGEETLSELRKQAAHVFAMKVNALPVIEGKFAAILFFDDKAYKREFEMRIAPFPLNETATK
jgi:hypothetical protein